MNSIFELWWEGQMMSTSSTCDFSREIVDIIYEDLVNSDYHSLNVISIVVLHATNTCKGIEVTYEVAYQKDEAGEVHLDKYYFLFSASKTQN